MLRDQTAAGPGAIDFSRDFSEVNQGKNNHNLGDIINLLQRVNLEDQQAANTIEVQQAMQQQNLGNSCKYGFMIEQPECLSAINLNYHSQNDVSWIQPVCISIIEKNSGPFINNQEDLQMPSNFSANMRSRSDQDAYKFAYRANLEELQQFKINQLSKGGLIQGPLNNKKIVLPENSLTCLQNGYLAITSREPAIPSGAQLISGLSNGGLYHQADSSMRQRLEKSLPNLDPQIRRVSLACRKPGEGQGSNRSLSAYYPQMHVQWLYIKNWEVKFIGNTKATATANNLRKDNIQGESGVGHTDVLFQLYDSRIGQSYTKKNTAKEVSAAAAVGSVFTIQLTPPFLDFECGIPDSSIPACSSSGLNSESQKLGKKSQFTIELGFTNENDYLFCKQFLTRYCFIAYPNLDQDYRYQGKIGSGAQATVDLYTQVQGPQQTLTSPQFVGVNTVTLNGCQPPQFNLIALPSQDQDKQNENSLMMKNESGNIVQQNNGVSRNVKFAVKKFIISKQKNTDTDELEGIINEVNFLRELQICENVAQIESVYVLRASEDIVQISLVMKYATYGSLWRFIKHRQRFNEEQIRKIMAQILLAVDLMHRNKIIHRDLKPDNVLLIDKNELQICITDLGLACKADDKKQIILKCGTPGFVAPEVLKNQPFTTKSDIFSLGVFLFCILTGKTLYSGNNVKEILLANKYSNPHPKVCLEVTKVSRECRELLLSMLQADPNIRPSAEQCIQHKWFSKDREALQGSLFINKNQQLLANLFTHQQSPVVAQAEAHNSEFNSFLCAPNLYQSAPHDGSQGSQCSPSSSQNSKVSPSYQRNQFSGLQLGFGAMSSNIQQKQILQRGRSNQYILKLDALQATNQITTSQRQPLELGATPKGDMTPNQHRLDSGNPINNPGNLLQPGVYREHIRNSSQNSGMLKISYNYIINKSREAQPIPQVPQEQQQELSQFKNLAQIPGNANHDSIERDSQLKKAVSAQNQVPSNFAISNKAATSSRKQPNQLQISEFESKDSNFEKQEQLPKNYKGRGTHQKSLFRNDHGRLLSSNNPYKGFATPLAANGNKEEEKKSENFQSPSHIQPPQQNINLNISRFNNNQQETLGGRKKRQTIKIEVQGLSNQKIQNPQVLNGAESHMLVEEDSSFDQVEKISQGKELQVEDDPEEGNFEEDNLLEYTARLNNSRLRNSSQVRPSSSARNKNAIERKFANLLHIGDIINEERSMVHKNNRGPPGLRTKYTFIDEIQSSQQ